MTINGLRKQFPDEEACRQFFESVIWASGRICPHCSHYESWEIKSKSARSGLYLCRGCRLQFTVTTKTPLHSTKLPLCTWLLAMYLMSISSKGISSIVLARLIGTTQKTAWKVGHAMTCCVGADHAILLILQYLWPNNSCFHSLEACFGGPNGYCKQLHVLLVRNNRRLSSTFSPIVLAAVYP